MSDLHVMKLLTSSLSDEDKLIMHLVQHEKESRTRIKLCSAHEWVSYSV